MNYELVQVEEIYDLYVSDFKKFLASLKPGDGILGFGRHPGTAACHETFVAQIEECINAIALSSPSSETAKEILEYVYSKSEPEDCMRSAQCTFVAVHDKASPLIEFLTVDDAYVLMHFYAKQFPASQRLPSQINVYNALCLKAGAKPTLSFAQKIKNIFASTK